MKKFLKFLLFLGIGMVLGCRTDAQTQPGIPLSPLNLKATLTDYNRLSLGWYDNSSNETGFKIYRSPAYSGTWSLIGTTNKDAISFSHTMDPGSYDYRVIACNESGCSSDNGSNIILVSLAKDTEPPSKPGDFSLPQKEVTDSTAKLYWSASTDNTKISHYNIYRSAGSANFFGLIASTSSYSYTDTKLAPITNYYYKIKAVDIEGNQSPETPVLNIITLPLPGTDNYIRIISPNGGECFQLPTNLSIAWTGVGVNTVAAYYGGMRIALTNSTTIEWYMDSSVNTTKAGNVKIVAVDAKGVEGISDSNDKPFTISLNCASESPAADSTAIPPVPTFVRANLISQTRDIQITWVDNSSNETEFRIYRRQLPNGQWMLLDKAAANLTYYYDHEVPPGDYEYDAAACNLEGCSAYSNTYKITAVATLPNPIPGKVYGPLEISPGDMIKASDPGDPDIYIINEHGYKRLFLNPAIFGFYGHLGGFERVKMISGATRDEYKTSGLFRNCETDDGKVYGVEITGEDTGTLHWVNTTGGQAVADDPDFFKKVFCINNNEFNWYQKGSDYLSVNQIPSYLR